MICHVSDLAQSMREVLPRVYSGSVAETWVYVDTYVSWGDDLDNYEDNNVTVVTGDAYDNCVLTIIPTWLHVTVVTMLMAMLTVVLTLFTM